MSSNQSIHPLIIALKKGDKSLFNQFYLSERKAFLMWMKKQYQLEEAEALDIYQQVMLILYENIVGGKLQELKSDIKTYFYGVAKNLMLKNYRKKEVIRKHADKLNEHWTHHWVKEDENFEASRQIVKEMFKEIKDPCQNLLGLFYFENRNLEEISSLLKYKNKAVVKVQKHRCLKYLKEKVLDRLNLKPHRNG